MNSEQPLTDVGPRGEWVQTTPELATRPVAVEAMAATPRLRAHMHRIVGDLLGTATRMAGHDCGRECVSAVWRARKKSFHASWNGRLSNEAFGQCFGVLRNVFHNAMARTSGEQWTPTRRHDVVRGLPDRKAQRHG